MAALALALAVLVARAQPASATSLRPLTAAQVDELAERIIEGRCLSSRRVDLPDLPFPATEYVFAVDHVLKGEALAAQLAATQGVLVIRQAGVPGTHGAALGIPDLPSYMTGRRYRIALNGDSRLGLTSPVGLGQGVLVLPDLPAAAAATATKGRP